jgi:hypothetical protein
MVFLVKKFVTFLAVSALATSILTSGVYAKGNNVDTSSIQEGVEVVHENGYDVTIKTTIIEGDINEYVEKLKKEGHKIHEVKSLKSTKELALASYLQEDYYYGSGSQYSSKADATGTVWTNDLMVGLNAIGGAVKGTIYSSANVSTVTSKPKLSVTTYGAVGGTIGVIKEYTFTPSSFGTGTVPYTINSGLTGAIAYYEGYLNADFKKGTIEWQALADLKKR